MTHLTIAALALAASLTAAPEKLARSETAKAAPGTEKTSAAKASKAALADARLALLGPCTKERASGIVRAISVIDGKAMNAVTGVEISGREKADPAALFLVVEYTAGPVSGKDYRQISTIHHLTTSQAQVLVGEKYCVFEKAP